MEQSDGYVYARARNVPENDANREKVNRATCSYKLTKMEGDVRGESILNDGYDRREQGARATMLLPFPLTRRARRKERLQLYRLDRRRGANIPPA